MTDFEKLQYNDDYHVMISRLEIARMTLKRHQQTELFKKYTGDNLHCNLMNLEWKFERDLDSETNYIKRYAAGEAMNNRIKL